MNKNPLLFSMVKIHKNIYFFGLSTIDNSNVQL